MTDSEQDIMRRIMIAVSKTGARVFRNNVAMAWVGKAEIIRHSRAVVVYVGDVLIRQGRPLHAGLCKGSSDLIGITPVIVRPEHVGTRLGVFTGLEVKTNKGRTTPEQVNFAEQINALGGIVGVVRDSNDAETLISKHATP